MTKGEKKRKTVGILLSTLEVIQKYRANALLNGIDMNFSEALTILLGKGIEKAREDGDID